MNKIITVIIAIAPCMAIAQQKGELQILLTNIHTMQAKFKQTVYTENKKPLQTYSGSVEFKKPHQFRWEVTKPDASLLITKTTTPTTRSPLSVSFSTTLPNLTKNFKIDPASATVTN